MLYLINAQFLKQFGSRFHTFLRRANFFFPPHNTVSEFSNPLFSYTLDSAYEYNYRIKITVIDSNFIRSTSSFEIYFIVIIIGVIFGLVLILYITQKAIKKRNQ